jgi:hypothetical protein
MNRQELLDVRRELRALTDRVNEALGELDDVEMVQQVFPGSVRHFDTAAEVVEAARAELSIDADTVKATAASVLGPPTGQPRTPDELSRVWEALQTTR